MQTSDKSPPPASRRLAIFGLAALAASGATAMAQAPDAPLDFTTALQKGTPILEFRPRFEGVDQSGRRNDGEAFTLRTRMGWQTAKWANLQATIEFEDVRQLGDEKYDSNVNGKSTFAQIFDPDVTELNRAQIVWTPNSQHTITLGRQRINIDDQRFIGGVAWRQDEQTFDAARIDSDLGRLDLTYVYIAHVNRIFAEAQDWGSDSHVATVSYAFAEPFKLTGFVYALDFTKPGAAGVRNQSSLTQGLKASGKKWLGSWKFDYAASFANQTEYGASLLDYSLEHYNAELTATQGPFAVRVNYESLGGNGTRGFTTPLATLHAFNGWSDAFIANGVKTTAQGLNDLNATLMWNPRWKWDYLFNIGFLARYHQFETETTGADLGDEIDFSAQGMITPRLSWLVKYADYDGPGVAPAPADRNKVWLGFEYKL